MEDTYDKLIAILQNFCGERGNSESAVETLERLTKELVSLREKKFVVYKNGSFKVISDGVTWEYENATDYLTTIDLNRV